MDRFRNHSFVYFETVFPEKPCRCIGQISRSQIHVEVLWVHFGFLGESLWVSEESQRYHAYGSMRRQEQAP